MVKKTIQCPKCGERPALIIEHKRSYKEGKMTEELKVITMKLETVLKSPKSAIEKKLEIFEVLEKIDFGELSASENKRVNNLIQSRLHAELAKKYMDEYKKSTAEEFSKT